MPSWSRRRLLEAGVAVAAATAGCTDTPLERTEIYLDNRRQQAHTVVVWVVSGGTLAVSQSVRLEAGTDHTLSKQLSAPITERRYHVTVQIDPEPTAERPQPSNSAYAETFTMDEGFDTLAVTLLDSEEGNGSVAISPGDAV